MLQSSPAYSVNARPIKDFGDVCVFFLALLTSPLHSDIMRQSQEITENGIPKNHSCGFLEALILPDGAAAQQHSAAGSEKEEK